jgi:hypothetical protein
MSGLRGGGHYRGERFALLTQHGKERVMAPLFADALDARLALAGGFDTDTLGTFTRDIERRGHQLDAARTKAQKGMELLGLPLGVASEGAFGSDLLGLGQINVELVVLVDSVRRLEIVGRAQGPGHHAHGSVSSREALEAFARRAGFPTHGLVVRPDHEADLRLRKGLGDWESLWAAFDQALAQSQTSTVFVESDLRADRNPTRMKMIGRATEDLLERIRSECPRCGLPGFWVVERLAGLRCRDCHSPTRETRAERWGCVAAEHTELRDISVGRWADPSRCDTCNP